MFVVSLCLGGLFLVLVHHLFDASWSVPIRRVTEHMACFAFPVLPLLFIPIAVLASGIGNTPAIYPWMVSDPAHDHALHSKLPLFTKTMFYVVAVLCLGAWGFLSHRLRAWSLRQDQTGSPECTFRMRRLSAIGIFVFAYSLTFAAIMWMKALQHQWFSTMYGVYYFAGSVWTTLATVYLLTSVLKQTGALREVVHEKQFYFIGSLLFAFTVFYAYITFSQYFIIWNANMPEETFWYVVREKGTWWQVGLVIIFGHFFLPFLTLLRIDWKLKLTVMVPICLWAWLMHFMDLQFNIMPVLHPDGVSSLGLILDLGCLALMIGLFAKVFIASFLAHPPFPQRDPRMAEGMDVFVPTLSSQTATLSQHGH